MQTIVSNNRPRYYKKKKDKDQSRSAYLIYLIKPFSEVRGNGLVMENDQMPKKKLVNAPREVELSRGSVFTRKAPKTEQPQPNTRQRIRPGETWVQAVLYLSRWVHVTLAYRLRGHYPAA